MPVTTRTGKCFSVGIAEKKKLHFYHWRHPGLDSVGPKKTRDVPFEKITENKQKKGLCLKQTNFLGKVFLVGGFNPFEKY